MFINTKLNAFQLLFKGTLTKEAIKLLFLIASSMQCLKYDILLCFEL